MNHKLILIIFVILLLLGMVPFSFTATSEPYIFGWLPFPLLYWWILMIINLIFVLWVAKKFTDSVKRRRNDE